MQKKSICFVVSAPLTVSAFLMNHIEELSVYFDVFLVANFKGAALNLFEETELKEVKDIEISRNISIVNDIRALWLLKKYFEEKQFDVIHTVTPKAGLLGVFAGKLAGVNNRIHIFTGQVWYTKTGLFKKVLMGLDKFIVWCATDILVDGRSQRQFLINANILKESNSFVLGKGSISGVDTTRFISDAIVRNKLREVLGIGEKEVVFMFLGRMNTDKGIIDLAHAFNKLQLRSSNARLLFVGGDEGNITPKIKEIVRNIDAVIFYGMTNTPEKMLQVCDVFCLPSYREGFGTSVIEASLLGKPVICSNTYGLMETIIDNKTGLRHIVADVNSLYMAMKKLLDEDILRLKLGKEGRSYVLNNFSSTLVSKYWVKFYKSKLDV